MSEDAYYKMTCNHCGGSVEFPAESEGATVPCPLCKEDLFLYRSVRAVGIPPVSTSVPPANPSAPINPIKPKKSGFDLFQKINNQEDARQIIRGVCWFYFALLVLDLILESLNWSANGYNSDSHTTFVGLFITAILAAVLCTLNSRIVAVIMLVSAGFGMVFGVVWVVFAFRAEEFAEGALESVILLLFFIVAIRAVEATFKYHGKYAAEAIASKPAVGQCVSLVIVGIVALVMQFYFDKISLAKVQTGQHAPDSSVQQTAPKQAETAPDTPEPEPAQPEAVQSDWNRQENDAMKNGNVAFAVQKILAYPNLRNQATPLDQQMVAKTPYNYYGQVGEFSGVVAVVQDYPTGSDNAIAGRESSDIVMVCSDGTIVELFCMKASGNMRVGDAVNLYGYPAGVTDVPNRLGGNDVHLIIVGNDYDDLGAVQ